MKRSYLAILLAAMAIGATGVQADTLVTRTISYEHGGATLTGYLAYDDAVKGRRPAVLVVHEWWGLNDYVRGRAEMLARMGYVAFAADMYGEGRVTRHPDQAGQWAKEVTGDTSFWRARAKAGLAVLRQQPQTDPERMAAIGYCFGGGTVQQLAYAGADLRGVVSFHGSLQMPPEGAAQATKARILMAHGGADSFMTPEQVQTYLTAMAGSGLDYQFIIYGAAKHGFTNPEAGRHGIAALAYDADADSRSWAHMKLFFEGIF